MDDYFYGIDFGTTNSAIVSTNDRGQTVNFGDSAGQPYPSVVAISKTDGKVHMVGREAKENREQLRNNFEIISSVKSLLGTDTVWHLGPRSWRPHEIVSEILKDMKSQVAMRRGELAKAMVAIPVGFSALRRKELREAARLAGIQIVGFVSEPTAAVYNSFERIRNRGKVAIFDWGGGTLDISVVNIKQGDVEELATSGEKLGGDDLDRKIAEWAHDRIKNKVGKNMGDFKNMPPTYRDAMLNKCEWAKRAMTNTPEAEINPDVELGAVAKLNAETLQELLRPQYDSVIDKLKKTIFEAKCSLEEIGCIIMVGGSSKLYGLYDRMVDEFPCEILPPEKDADWDIAAGASRLSRSHGEFILANTIGLILSDGTLYSLIDRGEKLGGTRKSIEFGLVEDTDNARFVFAEKKDSRSEDTFQEPNRIGYLTVPSFGFVNESIKLIMEVDEDIVLKIEAVSSNKSESSKRYWNYEKLTFAYRLPH